MMKTKTNVVFVITDDQGYGDLGCTGNPVVQTPMIDALYAQSLRCTDYHVGPTCAPTRAGLMTGHYHNSTGVWHTVGGRSLLRKDEVSLILFSVPLKEGPVHMQTYFEDIDGYVLGAYYVYIKKR